MTHNTITSTSASNSGSNAVRSEIRSADKNSFLFKCQFYIAYLFFKTVFKTTKVECYLTVSTRYIYPHGSCSPILLGFPLCSVVPLLLLLIMLSLNCVIVIVSRCCQPLQYYNNHTHNTFYFVAYASYVIHIISSDKTKIVCSEFNLLIFIIDESSGKFLEHSHNKFVNIKARSISSNICTIF